MATFDERALDRAFEVPARQVAAGDAPWAVVGIAEADGVVRLEAFPGPGQDVAVDAVCLLASITKPIVGVAVMQLVAEGRLSLTEPLTRVVPELAALGDPPITAWHLLSHTSGLADLDEPGLLVRGSSHEKTVRALLGLPRISPPGAVFRYATATFDILAAAITRLDGRPYPDAIHRRVLDPLAMVDTTFDPRVRLRERTVLPLASPFADAAGVVPDEIADAFIGMAMPGAGLWGTASDLLRFGRAMLRGGELDGVRVLPARLLEVMTRETTVGGIGETGDPATAERYALGWAKPGVATPGSPGAFGHGGIAGTRLWIDPAHDLVNVFCTGVYDYPGERIDLVRDAVYAAIV